MSSRVIEAATRTDVAVRYIRGNTAHSDHGAICRFRTDNREGFKEVFTKILVMVREMGYLRKVGNISVDGTKVHANASKHGAVSYKRAVEMMAETEKEVAELIMKADEVTVKEEMARRLKTEEGKKIYKKRKETVEPVFEIIKQAMGFRQFLLRGLAACCTCGFFALDAAKNPRLSDCAYLWYGIPEVRTRFVG
jgi:hypothetical protein